MDEFKAAQLAITQAQDSKIGEMQSDMREMKEMFKMFLNQAKAPENIPIPATPEPRPSARFATSTPFTSRTPGLDTTIRGNYTSRIEIACTEVETFIRRVEKLANLRDRRTGCCLSIAIPGSIPTLISKHTDKGGIQNREEYRSFVNDLEEILAYLTKMGYNDVNAGSGEPLWKAISAEMRKDVAKDWRTIKRVCGSGVIGIGPRGRISKTPSVSKKPETKKEVKTQPKEEEATGKVSELEEEIKNYAPF
ncbi:hypothetical protein H4Q26_018292 [Puccinia striiformis f. sp. tritici PST-130]|nr:hypothetical protein H4Q26_018292 [Puccinia striiformis f. sp. tritici PST-130]